MARLKGSARYLLVGKVEVFMHIHFERGHLQTTQVDDAILGTSAFDIVHCEEPVAVGIRLRGEGEADCR